MRAKNHRRWARRCRVAVASCLAVFLGTAAAFGLAGPVQAQESMATLTIHFRECPKGHTHAEYYDLCHDRPIPD